MARLMELDYNMGRAKKTYSIKAKKQQAYQEATRKQNQLSPEDDELRLPEKRSSGSSPRSRRLLKKPLKPYNGPNSLPHDDEDTIHVQTVFDKALKGKLKPQTIHPNTPSIYGSREDFKATIEKSNRNRRTNTSVLTRYLPTPPSETQKRTPDRMSDPAHVEMSPAKKAKSSDNVPPFTPTETSRFVQQIIQAEQPKVLYVPKQYAGSLTPAPRKNILGYRLSRKSEAMRLWSENQAKSALLRFPSEVRQLIYDYVFRAPTKRGSNTILIGHLGYRSLWGNEELISGRPLFKYYCTVLRKTGNPWAEQDPDLIATSYPLLNSACRQLYEETAVTPYQMNRLAFDSHNIMMNFLLLERRLSRKQCAGISVLLLPNDLPAANIMQLLPNLVAVSMAFESETGARPGMYDVRRPEGEEPYLVHSVTGTRPPCGR